MSKRTLTMIVAMVAALLIATTGTLAYLTDTDGAVNVMTIGNVDIEQIEEQRPEIGSTELEEFEQFKPLLPAVHDTNGDNKIAWAPESEWPVPEDYTGDHPEAYKVFNNNITNVQDKFVNVENTGKNDAYVRTIIAYEWPEELDDLIHISANNIPGVVAQEEVGFVKLDGVRYMVYAYTYDEKLAPGEETIPSLKQIFLNKATTSEDVALFGENFEVLALSQAVQADGFDNADEALNEGFYNVGEGATEDEQQQLIDDLANLLEEEYPWANADNDNFNDLITSGSNMNVIEDITAESATIAEGDDVHIGLQDHALTTVLTNNGTLSVAGGTLNSDVYGLENFGDAELSDVTMNAGSTGHYAVISQADSTTTLDNVDLTSGGGGVAAVDGAKVEFNSGSVYVDSASTSGRYLFYAEGAGSEITINDGEFGFSPTKNQKRAYIYAADGTTVYVNGGTFGPASTRSGYTAGILTGGSGKVIITGGTFGFNPSAWVADGYVATKSGSTWTVSAQ